MQTFRIQVVIVMALLAGACRPSPAHPNTTAGSHCSAGESATGHTGHRGSTEHAWVALVGLALTVVLGTLRLLSSAAAGESPLVVRWNVRRGHRRDPR